MTTHAALLADLAGQQPVRNPCRYAFRTRHGLPARRIPVCSFFSSAGAFKAFIWALHTRNGNDSKLPDDFSVRKGFSCPTHAHRTGPRKAARDRVERAGQKAHACAHLQARRVRCVQLAPSACSPCSEDGVDGVHDVIALHAVRLDGASCRLHAGWRHDTRHTHTCNG